MNYKKQIRYFLSYIFFILLLSLHVNAEEAQIEISKCVSYDYTSVELTIDRSSCSATGDFKIYRATTRHGQYRLIDIVYDNSWSLYNGIEDVWIAEGKRSKVFCFRSPEEFRLIDVTCKFNKKYYYKVGLTSGGSRRSEPVSARTKLNKPSLYQGYRIDSSHIKLTWQSVAGADGYIVYRKIGSSWKKIHTLTANTCTIKNPGDSSKFNYRVRAYRYYKGKKKLSDFSNTITVINTAPTVTGNYSPGSVYGPSLTTFELQDVKSAVQSFKTNYIRRSMSDYEKVLTAFYYLRRNCSYAWKGWQYNRANTAWGALVYGEAQCSGYARAMKALCDAIGIPCYYVHANSQAFNPSHQWNQVKVDGKWYILDAQGGAFLVSEKTYQNSYGMRWDKTGLPECTSDYVIKNK